MRLSTIHRVVFFKIMGYRKHIFSAMLTLFMSINRYYVAIVTGSTRWNLIGVCGLWCFTSLWKLLYRSEELYWWRKPECREKTIDLPQVFDKLLHIMLYRVHLVWAGFEFTTLVLIGTDCTCSSKSNYHRITTTAASTI